MRRDYLHRALAAALVALAAGAARAGPSLEVDPPRVHPGDALLVTVRGAAAAPAGKIGDRPLEFYSIPGGFQALAAVPVEAAPGAEAIEATAPAGGGVETAALRGEVRIEEANFRSSELAVARKYIEPSRSAKRRMKADQAAFHRAYQQPFDPPLFRSPFAWPRDPSELTGRFGDKRIFNGVKASQHYGDDLSAPMGAPVGATNDGRVVLVRDCYASGRTVVLWHGARLFSVYFHLSRFRVKAGQEVKRGQELGRVGRSGRATGPHLHWGMKVGDLYVDPESVIRLHFGAESPGDPASQEAEARPGRRVDPAAGAGGPAPSNGAPGGAAP